MKRTNQFERTDRDITNALLTLIQTHSFEKITVQMIIEEAMINRSTFYQHFQDKYEIVERLQQKYLDEFVKIANETRANTSGSLSDYNNIFKEYFLKNKVVLKQLFSLNTSSINFKETLKQYMFDYFSKERPHLSNLEVSMICGMTLDTLQYYLEDKNPGEDFMMLFFTSFTNITKSFFRLDSPEAEKAFSELLNKYSSR